jgi:O-antigen/teichoic acid export membrane protein
MRRLFLVGVGPIALTALLAPAVFPLAFGAEWSRAGAIVAWIAPWMLIQLMVSPVSMGLHVTGQIRIALLLQIFGLFLRAGAVGLAVQVPSLDAVASYAVSGVVFYTVYGITIVYKVRKK